MKSNILFLVFLVCGCSVAATKAGKTATGLKISDVSDLPPFTGIVPSWVRLEATSDGRKLEFLLPYFEKTKDIPKAGQVCDISFHSEDVDGQVGESVTKIAGANIIDTVKCKDSPT